MNIDRDNMHTFGAGAVNGFGGGCSGGYASLRFPYGYFFSGRRDFVSKIGKGRA